MSVFPLQGPEHPNPGKPFTARGFPRQCYLPDNAQGRKVMFLPPLAPATTGTCWCQCKVGGVGRARHGSGRPGGHTHLHTLLQQEEGDLTRGWLRYGPPFLGTLL